MRSCTVDTASPSGLVSSRARSARRLMACAWLAVTRAAAWGSVILRSRTARGRVLMVFTTVFTAALRACYRAVPRCGMGGTIVRPALFCAGAAFASRICSW